MDESAGKELHGWRLLRLAKNQNSLTVCKAAVDEWESDNEYQPRYLFLSISEQHCLDQESESYIDGTHALPDLEPWAPLFP